MDNIKTSPNLYFVAYLLGALLSATLAAVATWSDLEAAFYGFDRRASAPLQGLSCPVFLNRSEVGVVSVRISNTLDRKLSPSVRAEFSSRFAPVSSLESVEIPPGEARTVSWSIGPDNIDLKRFIFSQVLIFASYPVSDREASCGTFIIDLPIPGTVVLYLMVILGLGGLGGGMFLLNRSKPLPARLEKALRPLTFLAVVLVVALFVSLAGWWVQAILLLAVVLVTTVVAINFVFFR